MSPFSTMDLSMFVLNARGPLASVPALDVMWISFYTIGLMMVSILVVSAVRKWVHNAFLSIIFRIIAFAMFFIGTILMVLVVATWPS